MHNVVARTSSPAATGELAASLSTVVQGGDVVVLAGDLGAGKTTFVQGFAAALGVVGPVTSPTFTLVREYRCAPQTAGRPRTLLHADLYRLDHMNEVVDLGLGEVLEEDAVAVVEWGDAAAPALGDDVLEVRLDAIEDADNERIVTVTCRGRSWTDRRRYVEDAMLAWKVPTTAQAQPSSPTI
jgi:tRNA threonylcarbamoyladenosine biosynthesis protein TsaE